VLGSGWARPVIDASGQVWLAPQGIAVVNADQSSTRAPLPRADARLTLGVRFSFPR